VPHLRDGVRPGDALAPCMMAAGRRKKLLIIPALKVIRSVSYERMGGREEVNSGGF